MKEVEPKVTPAPIVLMQLAAINAVAPAMYRARETFEWPEVVVAGSYDFVSFAIIFWISKQFSQATYFEQYQALIAVLALRALLSIPAVNFAQYVGRDIRGE